MIHTIKPCVGALLLALCISAQAIATKPGDYYVTTDEASERLAPGRNGKVTNTLFKRQKVAVVELKDGWARVSKYYDGQVEGVQGQVARWVEASALSPNRPAEEKVDGVDKELGDALKDSDNFSKHRKAFVEASRKLIAERTCSLKDFKSAGGWMKSTQYSNGAVYFVYCGGTDRGNRLYLDVKTLKTFR